MPSNLKIFGLLGQSNMKGRGELTELSRYPEHPAFGDRIWAYKFDGTWESPPVEPLHSTTDSEYSVFVSISDNAGVGPGMFFADHLARYSDFDIGLVPCAKGGTSISEWARPGDGVDTTTLYGASRARIEAALASASGSELAGILWYQGEDDTQSGAEVAAWPAAFATLAANWRSDFSNSNLPIVGVILGPRDPMHTDWEQMQTNQSQQGYGKRTIFVPASDLTLTTDSPHIDTASQRILGRRMAGAMRVLGAGL